MRGLERIGAESFGSGFAFLVSLALLPAFSAIVRARRGLGIFGLRSEASRKAVAAALNHQTAERAGQD